MEHNISLKERTNLVVSGVEHIYSFNDKKVEVKTSAGEMVIEGENLDMSKLSLDENLISIEGTINSIMYAKPKKPQENFFKKVFK
ncbi:sporulation protein YabP [Romboutsia maritimum]|uniref:Sporulation protein YabP n=1 Tax=Romboutsia maritimum TaxID=2020948 RepID=A0A371ISY2_9FIRM|nr:YabP/YqfC family sporulation protein [Romboutsia maritimum]RDY23590.1 sporulation protein YabP [Romboutsia maritimum]